MLLDATQLDSGAPLRAEFCIVGTGMGGSALARKLVAAGRDVLLVEAGGVDASADGAPVTAEHVGRPFGMPRTRAIELGGTSNLWHGICAPFDRDDFEPRPWLGTAGWPIRRSDMGLHYEEALEALGMPDGRHFESLGAPWRARLGDIDFDRNTLENKLFLFRNEPRRWKHTLLADAREGRLRCLVNAPALELIVGEGGRSIDALVVGAGARTTTVRAEVFAVCAGALETPRLLLNSRRRMPAGVGNDRDLVGRFLMDHPVGHFSKLAFRRPTRAPLYAGVALDAHTRITTSLVLPRTQQRLHALPNHHVSIRPSLSPARLDDRMLLSFLGVRRKRDLTLRQLGAIVSHRDVLYRVLTNRLGVEPVYLYGDLFFMTEQLPRAESRVDLSEHVRDRYGYPVARVDWRLDADDLRAFEAYADLLLERGLRSTHHSVARADGPGDWARHASSAAHHLGTARMGADRSRGVVDADLKVFGMENLYVCDASTFPEAGSVNPSLTITALGLRLGDHLQARESAVCIRTPAHEPVEGRERPSIPQLLAAQAMSTGRAALAMFTRALSPPPPP